MRRPIPKHLTLGIIVSMLCFQYAFGQCQFDVAYSVEANSNNTYSVHLKSAATLSAVKVQLYDLYQGKIVTEKELSSLTTLDQEVFSNIPASKYTIIIHVDGCDKSRTLGGVQGINIGIQEVQ